MTRIKFTVLNVTQRSLRTYAPSARTQLFPKKDKPKHQEFELLTETFILSASNVRTAVKFWTLALKDQSAGPYDIIFSAINVTEEDKVNPNLSQKSRRISILLGGPQCFPPIFVWRPFSIYDYFN